MNRENIGNFQMIGASWRAWARPDGSLASLRRGDRDIPFASTRFTGPCWYGSIGGNKFDVPMTKSLGPGLNFTGGTGHLRFSLGYEISGDSFALLVSVANRGKCPVQPDCLGIRLGTDAYMEKHPDWLEKMFPTMLRCEASHFWGYLMSPSGKIVAVLSPDPIASWSLEYNNISEWDLEWGGHRIESVRLDLIHKGPLPNRHPLGNYQILPGEERAWTIHLVPIDHLEEIYETASLYTGAPVLRLDRTSFETDDVVTAALYSGEPAAVELETPDGKNRRLGTFSAGRSEIAFTMDLPGSHIIRAKSERGKTAEAQIHGIASWSWYLKKASRGAMEFPQKASTHTESWYGFFSQFLSLKYYPDWEGRNTLLDRFEAIYNTIFDDDTGTPRIVPERIQNTSSMISLLTDIFEATGDREYLFRAVRLADWMIDTCQSQDGSFRAGPVHYTSVIYPAKSLMELIIAEEGILSGEEGSERSFWLEKKRKHMESVKASMDNLVRCDGNIDTEGELTFEDGMISCSALQLAMFALTTQEKGDDYGELAETMINQHRALTQLVVPDGRMRGGTLRFWEAQYDVNIYRNFLTSPHGWSAWRIYAVWYLYLLTGRMEYLVQTINSLGSAVQLIDDDTGKLRWAFAVDPYVEALQISETPADSHPDRYWGYHMHPTQTPCERYVLGEQYVDMVGDWQFNNPNDNDVHEIFKCMEEVIIPNCYLHEESDGRFSTWNCKTEDEGGKLRIICHESCITSLHVNLKKALTIEFKDITCSVPADSRGWLIPAGEFRLGNIISEFSRNG